MVDMEKYASNINQVNTTDFILNTAHQKEDLIHMLVHYTRKRI